MAAAAALLTHKRAARTARAVVIDNNQLMRCARFFFFLNLQIYDSQHEERILSFLPFVSYWLEEEAPSSEESH